MKVRDESAYLPHRLVEPEYGKVYAWARSTIPLLGALSEQQGPLLYASPVSIGDYRIEVGENEVIDHAAALFAGRKDARTIALVRQGVDTKSENSLQGAVLPGANAWAVSDGDFIAVGLIPPEGEGIFREDNRIVEVLALVPYDRATRVYDLEAAELLEVSATAREILEAIP